MSEKTGGPAFPVAYQHTDPRGINEQRWEGMTLRDWFAGQALGRMLANAFTANELADKPQDLLTKGLARCAYEAADAMLEQRQK